MPPAVTVENLSKAYRIGLKEEIPDTFFQAATGWMRKPFSNLRRLRRLNTFRSNGNGHHANGRDEEDIIWALKDVSFEVQEGEVVGIIGRNGAGKSTLLKVLSRITEPTSGCARIRGRVSSLLEVGTGFHPELSGRENIYMNGTILGMTKREIDRKFDEIVDFSGVEKFLDTPIKRYSSGMQVRLAFSVAAHLEPEILIIDEVLAVGDAEFQKRCLGKMQDVAGSGRTVLFVSHNMAAVEGLCTRGVCLREGMVSAVGDVCSIIDTHLCIGEAVASDVDLTFHGGRPSGYQPLLTRLQLRDNAGKLLEAARCGDDILFEVSVLPHPDRYPVTLHLTVGSLRGDTLFACNMARQLGEHLTLEEPSVITCAVRNCRLMPGRYTLRLALKSSGHVQDAIVDGLTFDVQPSDTYGTGRLPPSTPAYGHFLPEAEWSTSSVEASRTKCGEKLGATP